MSYVALYRKFRPDSFDEVKGQDHIVTTLKNQIKAGRIGHAYLFTGTRGTGKTSIAKIMAKAVNCESPVDGSPCGQCAICKAISQGSSMNVIEIDAASNNGVDNIREIIEEVSYSPAEGKYKVYIIDEVHMLSAGAFNALLKTLEEPPSYVIFILATTEVHKIPITILSRCQRYDFRHIDVESIAGRLIDLMKRENVDAQEKALYYIAKTADGSMRDALSLLDQCISFHIGETLTYDKVLDVLGAVDTSVFSKLLRAVIGRSVLECIELLDEVVMKGRELGRFVSDFVWYLRNILLVKTSEDPSVAVDMSEENMKTLREEAKQIETETIIRYIRIFSELAANMKYATQKRIMVEVALIKLCRPQTEKKQDSLLDRLRALEEEIEKLSKAPALSREQLEMLGTAKGAGHAGGADSQAGQKQTAISAAELVAALPEDIKQAVSRWGEVVSTTKGMEKSVLQRAKLSVGENSTIQIVLPYGIAPLNYLGDEYKAYLEEKVSQMMGKQINLHITEVEEGRKFEDSYVDISKFINMEIEVDTEDDSEEDDFI
ncbi:MAG: DNA polymerase III subunit gamma/tau [Lachnospiraceae bacterium]|nr:DNA polymerase III subunit gamma/tau [Candidatus Merdinaster equi]